MQYKQQENVIVFGCVLTNTISFFISCTIDFKHYSKTYYYVHIKIFYVHWNFKGFVENTSPP